MFEIYGEVEISKFESSPLIDRLSKLYVQGKASLEELRILDKHRIFTHRQQNMLMNRFFDRLACAFSQSPDIFAQSVGLDWNGQDSHQYQNTYPQSRGIGMGFISPASSDRFELVPGLIGLGYGGSNLDVANDNFGLESPFPHDTTTPLPYNYRNTYNTKEGGTAPILTNRDYYILRCGAHWEAAWESRDGGPLLDIDEVGLFFNKFLVGCYDWQAPIAPTLIDITQGIPPPSNKAFEILNITAWHNPGGVDYLLTLYHDDVGGAVGEETYSWSEVLQQIVYNGGAGSSIPNTGEQAIVTFVPRYDHEGVLASGSSRSFAPPLRQALIGSGMSQLLARVVLTEPFQKSLAETLTVVWMIYFKRVT